MTAPATTAADVLVIFCSTGDLAKKMTFRSLYRLERRRMLQCPIIGVARDEWSAATLREHTRRAIEDSGETIDEDTFQCFAERLSMISGDYGDPKTDDRVAQAIKASRTPCSIWRSRRRCSSGWLRAWPQRASTRGPGSRWKSLSATISRRPGR
jgi:glucose-6-phosphate 1-dehydrogenase